MFIYKKDNKQETSKKFKDVLSALILDPLNFELGDEEQYTEKELNTLKRMQRILIEEERDKYNNSLRKYGIK